MKKKNLKKSKQIGT